MGAGLTHDAKCGCEYVGAPVILCVVEAQAAVQMDVHIHAFFRLVCALFPAMAAFAQLLMDGAICFGKYGAYLETAGQFR